MSQSTLKTQVGIKDAESEGLSMQQEPFPRDGYAAGKLTARFLNIGYSTLCAWVKNKPGFPTPRKLGPNTTRFNAAEIRAWAEDQE